MKLTALSLMLSLSAFAANADAQQVSVTVSNAKVKTVLNSISDQTGLSLAYSAQVVDLNRKVSLNFVNTEVSEVLNAMFGNTAIGYEIKDGKIYLFKAAERTTALANQQKKIITGTVVDPNGEAVIGANVLVKGTTNGTITDMDGKFSLEVPEGAMLQITYVGYANQEIKVGNQSSLSIIMKDDSEALDELVVVGYGVQRKGNIATSVTTIKSEVLQNRPVQTISEALQGQVPGLSVTGSAAPGSSPSLQLRGSSVLNSNNSSEPLVLVDGVPADFNFLNPEDIESINVLKDAASSAIYGSRAANGVLLITTKRGKEGKPTFRYNGSVGVNTPMHMPQTVSSAQYARIMNEAATNMGQDPIYTAEQIAGYEKGEDPNRYPNTDWLDLAIQNSVTTRHGIEASGGTEKVKYLVSAGVDHQTGIFPMTQQNVFNVRSNTDIKINKKFDISFDMRYQLRDMEELNNQQDIYKQIIGADPTMVAYYTDGTYGYNAGFFTNPLVALYEGGQKFTNRHEASGLFKLNYEIIEGLTFTGIANVKYTFKGEESQSRKLVYKNYFTQEIIEKGENSFSDQRDYDAYYNL